MKISLRDQLVQSLRDDDSEKFRGHKITSFEMDGVDLTHLLPYMSLPVQDRADRVKVQPPARLNVLALSIAALWGRA